MGSENLPHPLAHRYVWLVRVISAQTGQLEPRMMARTSAPCSSRKCLFQALQSKLRRSTSKTRVAFDGIFGGNLVDERAAQAKVCKAVSKAPCAVHAIG